mgnify:CR=1 FL=1
MKFFNYLNFEKEGKEFLENSTKKVGEFTDSFINKIFFCIFFKIQRLIHA